MSGKLLRFRGLVPAFALLATVPVAAQQRQYAEPGALVDAEVAAAERVRGQLESAPWKAGKVRLQPRLGLGDVRYVDNVFDRGDGSGEQATSDLRATALAGLDAYLPVGDDLVLSAFAHPTYTWWQDTESLRRFNVSYGAAAFGLFNRMTTQFIARRSESDQPVNNELRLRTAIRQDRAGFEGRVKLSALWRLFGSVATTDIGYPESDELSGRFPELASLERTEDEATFGIGYEGPDRLRIDVGWRSLDTQFESDPDGRSNRSDYPFARIAVVGNKIRFDLEGGRRQLDFDNPELGEQTERVGLARLTLAVGHRTSATLYNGRAIVYSALDAGSYFTSETTGLGLTWGAERELSVRIFGETGRDDFASAGGAASSRIDDVESVGLTVRIPLRAKLELALGITEIDIDSTLDDFDRTLTALRTSVRLDLPDFPF